MNKLEKKRLQLRRVSADIRMLEKKEFEKTELPKLRKLIGQYFKFRNSYGKYGDKWWLYVHVVDINDGGELVCNEIQDDGDGRIEIEYSKAHSDLSDSYIPSSQSEWSNEVAKLCHRLGVM